MDCISPVNFAVIINGFPSDFFKSSKGLQQGCPLSPLLFLLTIEGLSRLILLAKQDGSISGIKITEQVLVTHTLFVDDVMFFGPGSISEWLCYKNILDLFYRASGMLISPSKSWFLELAIKSQVCLFFPYNFKDIMAGTTYLSFFLKPTNYLRCDWLWLLKCFDKRINHWCWGWLTLGGRLTLAMSVLQNITVYWLSLSKIPKTILNGMCKRTFSFIWAGGGYTFKFHLVNWKSLARPRQMGGGLLKIWSNLIWI